MIVIDVNLSVASIDAAITKLEAFRDKLKDAGEKIAKFLANEGYEVAYSIIANHVYTGATLDNLTVEQISPTEFVLKTESEAILFFEFGAGALSGYGHPHPMGYGPGTYPGEGHWDDPNGWWFETEDPNLCIRKGKNGKMYGHTYGNPPHMPFWNAYTTMKDDVLRVAKEVLGVA